MTLFPVILKVARPPESLSGSEKVARLSRISREALVHSAQRGGIQPWNFEKDTDDVPRPLNDVHWSVSHKTGFAAGVVGRGIAGIDIEEIRPRKEGVLQLIANDSEWALVSDRSWHSFVRVWTAKEAVLKALGIGIQGLNSCKVVSVPDLCHVFLEHDNIFYCVEQLFLEKHVASVLKTGNKIEWTILDGF